MFKGTVYNDYMNLASYYVEDEAVCYQISWLDGYQCSSVCIEALDETDVHEYILECDYAF